MITTRTHEQPNSRTGYRCEGKVNTDASGIGLITIKGRDNSARITGIVLTPLNASDLIINCNITSIVYDAATRLTTITFAAQTQTGETVNFIALRDAIAGALTQIVANAPVDTAALLSELTTAAATITAEIPTATAPTGVAFDGDVYYSFWVDDEPEGLPSAVLLAANNTEEQSY